MHIHRDRQAETPNYKENLRAVPGNVYDAYSPSRLEESNVHTHTLTEMSNLTEKTKTVVGKQHLADIDSANRVESQLFSQCTETIPATLTLTWNHHCMTDARY